MTMLFTEACCVLTSCILYYITTLQSGANIKHCSKRHKNLQTLEPGGKNKLLD